MCHVSQYEHFESLNRHVSHGPTIRVRVRVRVWGFHLLCSMCYLELPRVLVNNRLINKTLQSLRNTCIRQRTAYSKKKVTKLWEHFPRFNNSKRSLCNRMVFFRPRLPIDAKEENVCNIVVTYEIRVFFEGAQKEVFSSIFFKKL
jgi:hypothetical protein